MDGFVVFVCGSLLYYWASRTFMLFKGREAEIEETLDGDLWTVRRLLIGLRTILKPPTELAG